MHSLHLMNRCCTEAMALRVICGVSLKYMFARLNSWIGGLTFCCQLSTRKRPLFEPWLSRSVSFFLETGGT